MTMRMTKKQFIAYRKALNKIKKDKLEKLSEEEKLELKLREKIEEEKTKHLADENKRMRLVYGKIEILQPLDPGISFPESYNYPNIKDEDIRILYIDFDYSLKPKIEIPELKAPTHDTDPVAECPLPYMVDTKTGKIVDKIHSPTIKKIPPLPKPSSYISSEEKARIRKERRKRRELFKKIAEGSMSNPFDPYSKYGPVVTPSPVSSLLITANNKTDVFLLSEVKEDDNDD